MNFPGDEASDKAALVAFYNATGGPNWTDNTNWLTDLPLSTWYGVEVFSSSRAGYPVYRRVGGLSLPDNNLLGVIPTEFSDLEALVTLDLSDNSISGGGLEVLGRMDVEATEGRFFLFLRWYHIIPGRLQGQLGLVS